MMVKRNWRKSRIIYLRENEHLVFYCVYTVVIILIIVTVVVL